MRRKPNKRRTSNRTPPRRPRRLKAQFCADKAKEASDQADASGCKCDDVAEALRCS